MTDQGVKVVNDSLVCSMMNAERSDIAKLRIRASAMNRILAAPTTETGSSMSQGHTEEPEWV